MFIDSHCHLSEKYAKSLEEVIGDAKKEGVGRFITIGTHVEDNKKVCELAQSFNEVFCAIGIYPHEDRNVDLHILENELQKLVDADSKLSESKIVGVGECGIDISQWENGRPAEEQIDLFEMQVVFAVKNNLPIVVHNRNGDELTLNVLRKNRSSGLRGVAHCFASSWKVAKELLDLNFYISFSGLVTYPSRESLLETVKNVPNDRFLLETDAPYLPPQGHRGEQNEPRYVRIVGQKVAETKGLELSTVESFSYQNTCELFGL